MLSLPSFARELWLRSTRAPEKIGRQDEFNQEPRVKATPLEAPMLEGVQHQTQ
jgi:hypothetical protein